MLRVLSSFVGFDCSSLEEMLIRFEKTCLVNGVLEFRTFGNESTGLVDFKS